VISDLQLEYTLSNWYPYMTKIFLYLLR